MPEEHIPSLPLEEMTLGEPIRQDHGIVCCPAIHNETGAHFVVRTIQIPADPEQANALLYSGACADETQVREYFAEKANNIVAQTKLLEKPILRLPCPPLPMSIGQSQARWSLASTFAKAWICAARQVICMLTCGPKICS